MSTGWPLFRYHFSTTLQSGTDFYQKKGWLWLHFLSWSHFSSISKKRYCFGTTLKSGTVLEPFFFLVHIFLPFFFGKTAPQWNQNGSTVEPKQLHFLIMKSGTVFNLFLENYGKPLHCGAVLANGTTLVRGTVFSSNMIIKKKNGSTFFSVKNYHTSAVQIGGKCALEVAPSLNNVGE